MSILGYRSKIAHAEAMLRGTHPNVSYTNFLDCHPDNEMREDGKPTVCLDGDFTIDELESIVYLAKGSSNEL